MKLSVFTVSMPDYDPMQTLQVLSEIGYDGVEWRTIQDQPHDPPSFWRGNRCSMSAQDIIQRADELKQAAAKHKMQMPTLAAYVDCEDLKAVELHMQAAAAIGAKGLRVGTGHYDPAKGGYRETLKRVRGQYAQVAKLAEKYGVLAMTEVHPGTMTPSMHHCLAVLDGLDPRHVGIIWDVANEVVEGLEVYRMALEIAGAYLGEVHVKNTRWDVRGQNGKQLIWQPSSSPVWEGVVQWAQVIAELKRIGYDGWLAFEDFSTVMPLRQRLTENHNWFRQLLAQ
jgi:sugar phosphate isomerase/epimerase